MLQLGTVLLKEFELAVFPPNLTCDGSCGILAQPVARAAADRSPRSRREAPGPVARRSQLDDGDIATWIREVTHRSENKKLFFRTNRAFCAGSA